MNPLQELFQDLPKRLFSKDSWKTLAEYVGLGGAGSSQPLSNPEILGKFIETRASHVAQTSLYGYLKTRAGTRFPEMFENPGMLLSMNMAKWQIWLACSSDLSVYLGGLIFQRANIDGKDVARLLTDVFDASIRTLGTPEDAAPEFEDTVEEVRQRIANTDFATIADDETAFSRSPESLYQWAPVDDELKRRDRVIVQNSIRFRWQEIRRSARSLMDAEALVQHLHPAT